MYNEIDYKACVKSAMKIMKNQRKKLYEDSLNYEPSIYGGLHSYDKPSVRDLYFQMYFSDWLGMHWELMNNLFENHTYSKDKKRNMIMFFVGYFSKLSEAIDKECQASNMAYSELLKEKKLALKEMLFYSENWEQNCNKLRVQMKKGHEQYMHMLKELEEEENA